MNLYQSLFTPADRERCCLPIRSSPVSHPLDEQYASLEEQTETAAIRNVGVLGDRSDVLWHAIQFRSRRVPVPPFPQAFEAGSEELNWVIGGINTIVLLVSSLMMALAVRSAQVGESRRVVPLPAGDGGARRAVFVFKRARVLHRLSGRT